MWVYAIYWFDVACKSHGLIIFSSKAIKKLFGGFNLIKLYIIVNQFTFLHDKVTLKH